jgi:SPP1 family predicted phage head-tail adaptor
MRAGKLRHMATLQSRGEARDPAYGAQADSWTDVASVWMAFEPMGGKEANASGSIRSQSLFRITLRYRSDVTPKMRIRFRDRIFNILNVDNTDERNRELTLTASEQITG